MRRMMAIVTCQPKAQYLARRTAIDRAVRRVLASGTYILGPEVRSFEREFASYVGAAFAVGVGSGTAALRLCLSACGVRVGDEVVTVSHTAVATAAAVAMAGARPVFADIEREHLTLDPARLSNAITSRTRAIVAVHLYGQPADLGPILHFARRRGIAVIEDCAQAHGAMYRGRRTGSIGDMAAFSFYPTKNLGGFGDGGMAVTSRKDLAEKVRNLREYGWDKNRVSRAVGVNSRLDEIQAAVLRVKLKHLDSDNIRRARLAAIYGRLLQNSGCVLPAVRPGCRHVFHQYVIRSKHRNALAAFLRGRGIQTLVHYPEPVHRQPAYRRYRAAGRLLETLAAAREVLSIPMYPELSERDVKAVADAILEFHGKKGARS